MADEKNASEEQKPSSESSQKIKELEDRLIRLQADFENHIKRSEKRNAETADLARADLILDLLPVLDQFELAIHHKEDAGNEDFRKGVEMIYKNLAAALKKAGLEGFDPYFHEAIKIEDGEDGKILNVVQKGYIFKGKVLRHAKVIVGRKTAQEKEDVTKKEDTTKSK